MIKISTQRFSITGFRYAPVGDLQRTKSFLVFIVRTKKQLVMKLVYFKFLFTFILSSVAFAQDNPAFDQLTNTADSLIASGYSGVILLDKPDQNPALFSGGLKNRADSIPVEEDDRFNIFSLGKSLTAAIILKLAEEGKLQLKDSISRFLPDSEIPNAEKITIEQLLGHTSGLGNYMDSPLYEFDAQKRLSINDIMNIIEKQDLVFNTPGKKFSYSNSGYIILGAIIEAVENKPYKNVLEEKILKPAGIENAAFSYEQPLEVNIMNRITF